MRSSSHFVAVGTIALALIAVSIPVRAQELLEFPPARAGLVSIPLPHLEALEPAVATQLRAAQQDLERAAGTGAPGRDLANAYGALAQLFHAYELFEPAEAAYINAARLASSELKWPYLLGYLYQQTGRFEEAADRFREVRRIRPRHVEATLRLGDVYLRLNRSRDAREHFEEVLEVFPALARNGLGEIALREGRFEEAIRYFRQVLERVPTATAVHYSLAMAYRGLGRLDEARHHLQLRGAEGIRVGDPIVDALRSLITGERRLVIEGTRAYEAGQLSEAIAFLERAHGLDPDDEEVTVTLAIALADAERFREAVDLLDDAHRRLPQRISTATTLARLLASSPDRSVRDGRRALELAMAIYASSTAAVDHETVALALAELERCGEALQWMQRAVAAAEQGNDGAEAVRLKRELSKYATASCRRW